jgi:hypothetical protein
MVASWEYYINKLVHKIKQFTTSLVLDRSQKKYTFFNVFASSVVSSWVLATVGSNQSLYIFFLFLSIQHIGERGKTDWLWIRIMSPSVAICQSADCCISALALLKSNSACWSSTKRTLSSSHWKLTCSRHDITEKLLNWCWTTILLYIWEEMIMMALLHMAGLENSECIWKIQRKPKWLYPFQWHSVHWCFILYRAKTGWLGIRIMCPSGATCLPEDCCFSELALLKSNSACWSSTKRTLSSSHWKLTCSRWRVSEWLLFNTNSAIFQLYHGENKLIFNEMMIRSVLYSRLSGIRNRNVIGGLTSLITNLIYLQKRVCICSLRLRTASVA